MNQKQIEQFEALAKPLMEWLKENAYSKTVVMTSEILHVFSPENTMERNYKCYDDDEGFVEVIEWKNIQVEKEISVESVDVKSIRGCDNCSVGSSCRMQNECNKQNGFPLFEEFPF